MLPNVRAATPARIRMMPRVLIASPPRGSHHAGGRASGRAGRVLHLLAGARTLERVASLIHGIGEIVAELTAGVARAVDAVAHRVLPAPHRAADAAAGLVAGSG